MVLTRCAAAVALAVAVSLTSAGCATIEKIRSGMSSASSMRRADISQWTADKMTQAFTAINAKIGADPADYEDVIVNELSVSVKAIDPNKRVNVDDYKYQGDSVQVAPVDVSKNGPGGAIEQSAFKGDTVKADVLAQVMNSAVKTDSGVENATIDFVMVKRMSFNDNEPLISVYVKGPRGSKIVQYDLTGHLKGVT